MVYNIILEIEMIKFDWIGIVIFEKANNNNNNQTQSKTVCLPLLLLSFIKTS